MILSWLLGCLWHLELGLTFPPILFLGKVLADADSLGGFNPAPNEFFVVMVTKVYGHYWNLSLTSQDLVPDTFFPFFPF